MSLQQLFTSRKSYDAATYVARAGKMFYDEATGNIRLGDGITAGGLPIPITLATSNTAGAVKPAPGFTVSSSGTLTLNAGPMFELTVNDEFILKAATDVQIGGVKLGPGVTTNGDGQIIIDPEGLSFSFGDFTSTVGTYTNATIYAVLQTINTNEDMVLASNGAGGIQVVGEFRVHATNGALTATLESTPAFEIKADGQVKILVPTIDSTEGAVSIVGSSTGEFVAPVNTGVMLHITGQYASPGIPSRVYNDSQNAFAAFVGRRFNGTVSTSTAVLADEELMRITATAHNGTAFPTAAGQRISYRALGNQTLTNGGGAIEFWTTPLNTTSTAKVATVNNADGITATKFTGPLTGTATTATNLAAATGILAGSLSVNPANVVKNTAAVQTFTLTGLTTNHKIVITSGTAIGYGIFISAAWASAANTLSIEFQNFSNTDINLTDKNIQYFAWV